MGRGEAHCLCWWGFWCRLLVSFWFRNDPKTVVILWFLFVYSPIKLSKRRIKFDQHFPITLHQAVHNAVLSPSSLVASTTTLVGSGLHYYAVSALSFSTLIQLKLWAASRSTEEIK
jgi:hypothetical protein